MDAPPPQEDVRPFVHVAHLIEQAGLNAPRVLAQDVEHGFLLLTDLGSRPYLAALRGALDEGEPAACGRPDARRLRRPAGAWQQRVDPSSLPPYDDALLRRELALFPGVVRGSRARHRLDR